MTQSFSYNHTKIITIYSLLIGAWPMVLLNSLLAAINGYHYIRLIRNRENEQA